MWRQCCFIHIYSVDHFSHIVSVEECVRGFSIKVISEVAHNEIKLMHLHIAAQIVLGISRIFLPYSHVIKS